jgi:hypothetical protein
MTAQCIAPGRQESDRKLTELAGKANFDPSEDGGTSDRVLELMLADGQADSIRSAMYMFCDAAGELEQILGQQPALLSCGTLRVTELRCALVSILTDVMTGTAVTLQRLSPGNIMDEDALHELMRLAQNPFPQGSKYPAGNLGDRMAVHSHVARRISRDGKIFNHGDGYAIRSGE